MRAEVRELFPILLKLYVPAFLFLAVVFLISRLTEVPFGDFLRDEAAVRRVHPVAGLVNHVGVLIWSACACICLFCAFKIRSFKPYSSFLLLSGLLTSALFLDDMFMFHDFLAKVYLGVPKTVVYVFYIIATGAYLVAFRSIIFETRYLLLLFAFGFFALSMLSDLTWISGMRGRDAFEDGCKFFGIVTWSFYYIHVCSQLIDRHMPIRRGLP